MLQKIKSNLLLFLELQLLISIVMLPILIAWGLAISIMAIIGNLIFAQFLTAFIFTSTLLYTTDLFGIPNQLIATILDWITYIWYYFLSYGSPTWLIGFPSYMLPASFIAALIACSLYYCNIKSQIFRIAILTLLCGTTLIINLICNTKFYHATTVMHGLQKIYIFKKNGVVYAFDCGALSARKSAQSWIEYRLFPYMIKNIGATHIDLLVVCKSNSRTLKATQLLTEHIPTRKVINIHKKP